jgi:folate-dependent phosphoribosylglycinamide formyltransferase PurN
MPDARRLFVILNFTDLAQMKIALLTSSSLNPFRIATLLPILRDSRFSVDSAIIDDRPGKSILEKTKRNLKKGRGGYVLIMAFQKVFGKKEPIVDTEKFCKDHGISIYRTSDIYSQAALDFIREKKFDILLLTGGYGILREPLLSVARHGILSYHHGDMRKYRGQPPAFWELYNGEKEMGVTVQILTAGLDCGIPVVEKTITINRGDTLKKLTEKAYSESIPMMYEALLKIEGGIQLPGKIENPGKIYTIPNLRQWMTMRCRMLVAGCWSGTPPAPST